MGPRGCWDPGKGNQRRGSSVAFCLDTICRPGLSRSPQSSLHCATRAQPTEPHQPATRAEPHLAQPKPRRPGGPEHLYRRRGLLRGPAPSPPALPAPRGLAALRRPPVPAPGSQQPRREAPAEGRAPAVLGFSSCRGRRDCSVSVGDRARRALRPPRLPSSACSPYQSDGLQRKDRRHSARPFEPDGGGNRRDSRRSTERQLAAGSRGETRRVAAGAGRE